MPDDIQWMANCVAKAWKGNALVTQAAIERIGKALAGELSEGSLSSGKLKGLAAALIADMVPAAPGTEADK
ncbi:hypothetical protein [Anaerobaca lacustris]|uniref:Uncharacterized protein n=1 Tax=Anaerobaca lacustris TaxID=3044600 RepID=A0AAW6U5E2_9BACT|nr:hypothetical protein [Sedimentisphaerales bacterium M17dextr]